LSVRQQKVSRLIQKELSTILQKYGAHHFGKALVTITEVRVTPDLAVARIYVSIFNHKQPEHVLSELNDQKSQLRGQLGSAVRTQLRIVPELEFFHDTTLDQVFRIEELLKNAKGDH
jgi:ribosome-binding factor A